MVCFGHPVHAVRVRLRIRINSRYAWAALIGGALLVMFGIAWAGSSFVEGMPTSGALGLTLFTGPGIVAMTLAYRYWVAPGLKGS